MACAQCHNHKFDPYTQKDFYSFAAFFADVSETAVGRQAQTKIPTAEQEKRIAAIELELAAVCAGFLQRLDVDGRLDVLGEQTHGALLRYKQ